MPFYDFKCGSCGEVRENVFLRMAEIGTDREPECCDARMVQILHPTMVHVQGECHYRCPKTGEEITSRRQRRENFARHNLMDANDFTPAYLQREQEKYWGPIRELAAKHDQTNNEITGGRVGLDDLVPADAGA